MAVVKGGIDEDIILNYPIGRHKTQPQKMDVVFDEKGKPSLTELKVLEKFKDATFVELTLRTGRTHQIRVHLKDLGYPIVGDKKYGDKKTSVGRLLLHASYLKLLLPNGKVLEITARLPKEMQMFEEKS